LLAKVPVVVISAAADLTDIHQRHGCRVMRKPVNIDALTSLAREYCEAA
jgi:hypothetical protein